MFPGEALFSSVQVVAGMAAGCTCPAMPPALSFLHSSKVCFSFPTFSLYWLGICILIKVCKKCAYSSNRLTLSHDALVN